MKQIALILLFSAAQSNIVYSQKVEIKIRQSFESADAKSEPAVATYTKPESGSESYLIDGAIGISVPVSAQHTITGFFEYHRNTLIDEESNTLQGGFAYEVFTNNQYLNGDNRNRNGSTTLINASGKYSNNKIKKIESLQITGEITRLYAKGIYPAQSFLPNAWNQIGNFLAIEYFPAIGIEYESRYKADKEDDKGNILRPMGKIDINLYPFSMPLKNKIELYSNFHFRYDILNLTLIDDKTHPSFEGGVNFILYRKGSKKAALGFSYNNIDDPISGEEKQAFWLLALKIKY